MSTAVAPEVVADPALAEAQAAVDAHEAAKVTDDTNVADTTTETATDETTESAEQKEARARGEDGKFVVDYTKVVLPKDAAIDSAVLERTVATARERGLSIEQAQAVTDLVAGEITASRAALLADHQPGGAAWTKMVDGWKAETMADPALGKTVEERTAAVARGAGVLRQFKAAHPERADAVDGFLNDSGLGDHPVVAQIFNWLGKVAGERPVVLANGHEVQHGGITAKYIESGMNP